MPLTFDDLLIAFAAVAVASVIVRGWLVVRLRRYSEALWIDAGRPWVFPAVSTDRSRSLSALIWKRDSGRRTDLLSRRLMVSLKILVVALAVLVMVGLVLTASRFV